MCRHGASSNGDAARHDDGEWHAHAARNGHGCARNDGHAHAASRMTGTHCQLSAWTSEALLSCWGIMIANGMPMHLEMAMGTSGMVGMPMLPHECII